MTTHDIELPAEFRSGNSVPVTVATIKRERMEEIIRAAIEADRKRGGEPVGYFYPWELERSLKAYPNGFPGAVAVYAAPQPIEPSRGVNSTHTLGEPVAWTTPDEREPISAQLKESRLDLYSKHYTVPLYTTPQPAEPCASLMSDKPACGSENGDCDSQPAEPVKVPSMRDLIADDAYAATFQSVGQYRKALLARYGKGAP